MNSKLNELLQSLKAKGEQVWIVRIAPIDGGKSERWIVSPIGSAEPGNNENEVQQALEAVSSESPDAEIWDCAVDPSDTKITWTCVLQRAGRCTGPKGHVFDITPPQGFASKREA